MIQVFTFDQGSPDWFEARRGIPTASEFHKILAKGEGKTRRTYLLKLAGEALTGELMDSYTNEHMERGKVMEDEARNYYELVTNATAQRVGFIRNGQKGCSPDSLVGADGLLEIKTKLPHLQLECLLKNSFPAEHKAQCQGQLWIAEREWIDLTVYWPRLPTFIKRAYRDDDYIKELSAAVDKFNDELAEIVAKFQRQEAA